MCYAKVVPTRTEGSFLQMKKLRGNLMLLLTALIWGSAFVAQTVGMDHVGPFTFNCARMFLGALVLLPVIAWREEHNPANKKAHGLPENGSGRVLAAGGISCGVMLFLGSSLQQCGLQYTTPGKAGFITALYVVLVPIAGLLFGRKPRWWVWLSVVMSAAGLWLLCMNGAEGLSLGDGLVLLCALAFTGHILCADHFSPLVDGVKLSCIQFLTCGILSGIPALLLEHPELSSILAAWQPILYAGVMSCGVAYTLQIIGQKNMNPTVASLILSLESCISVLAGWSILGQQLSTKEILGCVIMFAAIILAQLPQKQIE